MRRFNRPLYRTARSILKDDTEAEDVLQEAYLLAYRGIKSFRGDVKLLTWLTRIVVNEAIARSRKTARQAEVIQLGAANCHTPEKQMGLPDACKALNTHIHPNMVATQETPLTPEREAGTQKRITSRSV
jgi:RNA polymerase sigma factor (sigma-70 family)